MIRRTALVSLCSALATAWLAVHVAAAPAKALPPLTFTTLDGGTIESADLKGKVVVLDFWASWCIPCRKSFPEIDRLSKEFASKGVTVIAVNVDEQRKNADAFLSQYPHQVTVAFDSKGVSAKAFDLQGMPSSLIIDRSGRVRFRHMGYTDKTIAQFRTEIGQLLTEAE
ncbi:MAG: TlpA disulfide reductase family protein [Vicinamibacterales bacterium]